MSCKAAKLDPEEGRYICAVSGDGCMYMRPDSKRCAEDWGEGPNADNIIPTESMKKINVDEIVGYPLRINMDIDK
ncbi:MAG: hypothetical protein M0P49_03345 [Bacilli bacterium]|nr:hypothetical protein [Bacilli bacterium]